MDEYRTQCNNDPPSFVGEQIPLPPSAREQIRQKSHTTLSAYTKQNPGTQRHEIFDRSIYAKPGKIKTDAFEIAFKAVALQPYATALFDIIVYRQGYEMDVKFRQTWLGMYTAVNPHYPPVVSAFFMGRAITFQPAIILATSWNDWLISHLFDRVNEPDVMLIISPASDAPERREPNPRILVLENGYSLADIYKAVDEAMASLWESRCDNTPADDNEEDEDEDEDDSD